MAETMLEFEKPIAELRKKLKELSDINAANPGLGMSAAIKVIEDQIARKINDTYSNLTPWQRVQLARHPQRPYTLDYVNRIFTDFMEFHGDRRFSDDKAIVGGFAMFGDRPVMVIGNQKGRGMQDNLYRNFGWAKPEGYRKARRLMRTAERAGCPLITFIDTPGAYPGIESEERHMGEAIAVNLREMFALRVPVIAVVIGEGGSGGAIALGVGNKLLIQENAYFSVITPEGCAAILWKDRAYADKAAAALRLTAHDLINLKIADELIPEPLGGAQTDYDAAAAAVKAALERNLRELEGLSIEELREQRYNKFRNIGEFSTESAAAEPAPGQ